MTPTPDVEKVTAILREAAEKDILPRFRNLGRHEVMSKHGGEIVTVADLEAEKRLTRRLSDLVPGSLVVGEESVAGNPAILEKLEGAQGPAWLVDPVDGTNNFASGSEVFAIIVCFLVDGQARAGWIHDPVSAKTATAVVGEGAWYDGARLSAAGDVALEEMTGMLNLNYFQGETREVVRRRAKRFRKIHSYRCAAHDYLALARGGKHFSLYRRLWPWDHAAGVLMLSEAGGRSARLDGAPYRAGDRVPGLLSASDPDSWQKLKKFFTAA